MINIKYYKLAYYMCICNATQRNATQRILQLYILTNNYLKFLLQKIFFAMRACDVNLVKSFLTLIKFNFDSLLRKIKNPCLVINKNSFIRRYYYVKFLL